MEQTRIKKYKEYRDSLQCVDTSFKIEEEKNITATLPIDEILKDDNIKKDELELITKKLKIKYTKITVVICVLVSLFFILLLIGILIWRK